jgi:protein SCO1/2
MRPSRRLLLLLPLPSVSCLKSSLPEYGNVPAFELIDERARPFRSAERLKGKTWVAAFIFTTCNGPCPRMSAQMRRVQDETRDLPQVSLVSFSIDPETDTPERLSEYARRFKADPARWSFLTGDPKVIRALGTDTFHLADPQEKLAHSSRFALVDRHGRIRGYYDTALSGAIPEIVEDIRRVEREWL